MVSNDSHDNECLPYFGTKSLARPPSARSIPAEEPAGSGDRCVHREPGVRPREPRIPLGGPSTRIRTSLARCGTASSRCCPSLDRAASHPQGYQDAFNALISDAYVSVRGATPEGLPVRADDYRSAVLTEAMLRSHRTKSWVNVSARLFPPEPPRSPRTIF